MKNTLALLQLLLFGLLLPADTAAQSKNCYREYRDEGYALMQQKRYSEATNMYWAAMLTCADKPANNDLSELIQKCNTYWVRDLEASVQKQKQAYETAVIAQREAETAKVLEEQARLEAEANARKAREQGIRAESLRMALLSDMVRQQGRVSEAFLLAYLAIQMAGPDLSPPMMRAFGDAVRDSMADRRFNGPDPVEQVRMLAGGSLLLQYKNNGFYIVGPGNGERPAQVTRLEEGLTHVVPSPAGDRFVGWGKTGPAKVFDASGTVLALLSGHTEPVRAAAFSSDGQRIATGSRDNTARIWDLTGKTTAVLDGHGANVQAVAFAAGDAFVLTRATDGTARTWTPSGNPIGTVQSEDAYLREAFALPGETPVAAVFSNGTVATVDQQGGPIASWGDHNLPAQGIVCASNGARVAVRLGGTTVRIGTPTGAAMTDCKHPNTVLGMALSGDGTRLLTWANDRVVRFWNDHGDLLLELRGHRAEVLSAVLAPDERHILTTSYDGTAKLWNLNGHLLTDWESGPRPIAQFLPDGQGILTTMNAGKSVAFLPLPDQVLRQVDQAALLVEPRTRAVLEAFNVQFLEGMGQF